MEQEKSGDTQQKSVAHSMRHLRPYCCVEYRDALSFSCRQRIKLKAVDYFFNNLFF